MARHRSRYLWTAMNDGSRKPAEATRRMNAWDSGGGWQSAWATDDWRQCSPANRRSRRRASSGANFRWRARTRALREFRLCIWGSPHGVYLRWAGSKFLVCRTFPDISGHSGPVLRDRFPEWGGLGLSGSGGIFRHQMPCASVAWLDLVGGLGQVRREVELDSSNSRVRSHGLGTGNCQCLLIGEGGSQKQGRVESKGPGLGPGILLEKL